MRRSLVALALAVMLPLPALAGQVTVRDGETLSQIAERHGISLNQLIQINGIRDPDRVVSGTILKLPGGRGGTAAGSVTVQPGQTLSEIAEQHGISLARLMQINGIRDANQVEAGKTLRLQSQPTARTATGQAPRPYPRGASEHVVRSGESLSGIASGYGIDLSRLIALNAISDPDRVDAGTRLKLKGTPAPTSRPKVSSTSAATPAARPQVRNTTPAPVATATTPAPVATATTPAPVVTATATPAAAAASAAPVAAARPAATTRPVAVATNTAARPAAANPGNAAAATTPATTVAIAKPDWRTYGPLQVNWAAWQPMGGSMVAPTLNREGQSVYVAINCGARKFNATTPSGEWQSWNDPNGDYEQQLVSDYCRSRS